MASTMNNCMSPASLMLPTVLTIGPLSTRSTPCHLLVCPCGSPYHHAGHGVRKGGAPDDDAARGSVVDARGAHLSREAWKQGFLKDVVAQIPLSLLNFAVAVCKLTRDVPIEGGVNDVSVGDHGRLLVRHHVMLSRRRRASTSSMSTTVVLEAIKLALGLRLRLESWFYRSYWLSSYFFYMISILETN
jgi:hypothetical protein